MKDKQKVRLLESVFEMKHVVDMCNFDPKVLDTPFTHSDVQNKMGLIGSGGDVFTYNARGDKFYRGDTITRLESYMYELVEEEIQDKQKVTLAMDLFMIDEDMENNIGCIISQEGIDNIVSKVACKGDIFEYDIEEEIFHNEDMEIALEKYMYS